MPSIERFVLGRAIIDTPQYEGGYFDPMAVFGATASSASNSTGKKFPRLWRLKDQLKGAPGGATNASGNTSNLGASSTANDRNTTGTGNAASRIGPSTLNLVEAIISSHTSGLEKLIPTAKSETERLENTEVLRFYVGTSVFDADQISRHQQGSSSAERVKPGGADGAGTGSGPGSSNPTGKSRVVLRRVQDLPVLTEFSNAIWMAERRGAFANVHRFLSTTQPTSTEVCMCLPFVDSVIRLQLRCTLTKRGLANELESLLESVLIEAEHKVEKDQPNRGGGRSPAGNDTGTPDSSSSLVASGVNVFLSYATKPIVVVRSSAHHDLVAQGFIESGGSLIKSHLAISDELLRRLPDALVAFLKESFGVDVAQLISQEPRVAEEVRERLLSRAFLPFGAGRGSGDSGDHQGAAARAKLIEEFHSVLRKIEYADIQVIRRYRGVLSESSCRYGGGVDVAHIETLRIPREDVLFGAEKERAATDGTPTPKRHSASTLTTASTVMAANTTRHLHQLELKPTLPQYKGYDGLVPESLLYGLKFMEEVLSPTMVEPNSRPMPEYLNTERDGGSGVSIFVAGREPKPYGLPKAQELRSFMFLPKGLKVGIRNEVFCLHASKFPRYFTAEGSPMKDPALPNPSTMLTESYLGADAQLNPGGQPQAVYRSTGYLPPYCSIPPPIYTTPYLEAWEGALLARSTLNSMIGNLLLQFEGSLNWLAEAAPEKSAKGTVDISLQLHFGRCLISDLKKLSDRNFEPISQHDCQRLLQKLPYLTASSAAGVAPRSSTSHHSIFGILGTLNDHASSPRSNYLAPTAMEWTVQLQLSSLENHIFTTMFQSHDANAEASAALKVGAPTKTSPQEDDGEDIDELQGRELGGAPLPPDLVVVVSKDGYLQKEQIYDQQLEANVLRPTRRLDAKLKTTLSTLIPLYPIRGEENPSPLLTSLERIRTFLSGLHQQADKDHTPSQLLKLVSDELSDLLDSGAVSEVVAVGTSRWEITASRAPEPAGEIQHRSSLVHEGTYSLLTGEQLQALSAATAISGRVASTDSMDHHDEDLPAFSGAHSLYVETKPSPKPQPLGSRRVGLMARDLFECYEWFDGAPAPYWSTITKVVRPSNVKTNADASSKPPLQASTKAGSCDLLTVLPGGTHTGRCFLDEDELGVRVRRPTLMGGAPPALDLRGAVEAAMQRVSFVRSRFRDTWLKNPNEVLCLAHFGVVSVRSAHLLTELATTLPGAKPLRAAPHVEEEESEGARPGSEIVDSQVTVHRTPFLQNVENGIIDETTPTPTRVLSEFVVETTQDDAEMVETFVWVRKSTGDLLCVRCRIHLAKARVIEVMETYWASSQLLLQIPSEERLDQGSRDADLCLRLLVPAPADEFVMIDDVQQVLTRRSLSGTPEAQVPFRSNTTIEWVDELALGSRFGWLPTVVRRHPANLVMREGIVGYPQRRHGMGFSVLQYAPNTNTAQAPKGNLVVECSVENLNSFEETFRRSLKKLSAPQLQRTNGGGLVPSLDTPLLRFPMPELASPAISSQIRGSLPRRDDNTQTLDRLNASLGTIGIFEVRDLNPVDADATSLQPQPQQPLLAEAVTSTEGIKPKTPDENGLTMRKPSFRPIADLCRWVPAPAFRFMFDPTWMERPLLPIVWEWLQRIPTAPHMCSVKILLPFDVRGPSGVNLRRHELVEVVPFTPETALFAATSVRRDNWLICERRQLLLRKCKRERLNPATLSSSFPIRTHLHDHEGVLQGFALWSNHSGASPDGIQWRWLPNLDGRGRGETGAVDHRRYGTPLFNRHLFLGFAPLPGSAARGQSLETPLYIIDALRCRFRRF